MIAAGSLAVLAGRVETGDERRSDGRPRRLAIPWQIVVHGF
ncbi:hypothetical protein C485_02544 [Natrinema altunense JCM 12890]|uniref:Uncharacterized protein n=1 Tax=Natrinema altunense (strain JCM 12890 / CGMCC 1.3731 / AJ2) TaxID=1227494 RepID=L9ZY41_NATA2|nr:hypothetical protein C485_02544 [Natrinema altunense JCM 12890]